jgi:phosphoribosylglycinamide formyltransferase-1
LSKPANPSAASRPLRLALFVSGNGTNAAAIIKAWQEGKLTQAEPMLMIANRNCPAIEKAKAQGLETLVILPRDFSSREAHEEAILKELRSRQIELIALAGYMRLLTPTLINPYQGRIINIHPALLPEFPGTNAIERAYKLGVPFSGVTCHLVDEGMDSGPILDQVKVDRLPDMSLDDFEAAIHRAEHQLYPRCLEQLAAEVRSRSQAPVTLG